MKHLILGGARSGKSRFAENTGLATEKKLIYIATSQALDDEMQARIHHHQTSRDTRWITIEEPLQLAKALQQHAAEDTCILVDCLTLWLTNLLLADDDIFIHERTVLLDVVPQLTGDILLVSNEVGMGIVPLDPLSRRFVMRQAVYINNLPVFATQLLWLPLVYRYHLNQPTPCRNQPQGVYLF